MHCYEPTSTIRAAMRHHRGGRRWKRRRWSHRDREESVWEWVRQVPSGARECRYYAQLSPEQPQNNLESDEESLQCIPFMPPKPAKEPDVVWDDGCEGPLRMKKGKWQPPTVKMTISVPKWVQDGNTLQQQWDELRKEPFVLNKGNKKPRHLLSLKKKIEEIEASGKEQYNEHFFGTGSKDAARLKALAVKNPSLTLLQVNGQGYHSSTPGNMFKYEVQCREKGIRCTDEGFRAFLHNSEHTKGYDMFVNGIAKDIIIRKVRYPNGIVGSKQPTVAHAMQQSQPLSEEECEDDETDETTGASGSDCEDKQEEEEEQEAGSEEEEGADSEEEEEEAGGEEEEEEEAGSEEEAEAGGEEEEEAGSEEEAEAGSGQQRQDDDGFLNEEDFVNDKHKAKARRLNDNKRKINKEMNDLLEDDRKAKNALDQKLADAIAETHEKTTQRSACSPKLKEKALVTKKLLEGIHERLRKRGEYLVNFFEEYRFAEDRDYKADLILITNKNIYVVECKVKQDNAHHAFGQIDMACYYLFERGDRSPYSDYEPSRRIRVVAVAEQFKDEESEYLQARSVEGWVF